MAGIDVDRLLTEAHAASWEASKSRPSETYREYAFRLAEAYEALEQAYKLAQRELDAPPQTLLWWALFDAEQSWHQLATQMRREAAR